MKFTIQQHCDCGASLTLTTSGSSDWPAIVCTNCSVSGIIVDPLSVSIIAERILYRAKHELENGDYTLTVLLGAIAVESFITKLFLKLKRMELLSSSSYWPTRADEEKWEKQFKRIRGFEKISNFISTQMTNKLFDEFVCANSVASKAVATFSEISRTTPSAFIQTELFERRNRIAHWGFVDSTFDEASACLKLSVATVRIFNEMDRIKFRPNDPPIS
jgi:hypothetical protein